MSRTHLARRTLARPQSEVLTRRIVGTPAEVAATVALVRDTGRLLSMTAPTQLPGDPRVVVTVRLVDSRTRVRARRRVRLVTVVVVSTVGGLAALAYLAAQLARTAHATGPALLGVVLVLVVIARWWRSRRSSGCTGLHCSGCTH